MAVDPTRSTLERRASFDGNWRDGSSKEGLVIESWGQGFMIGALIIMACITLAAMRKGVLLHKLILTEQILAMAHGTFCFMSFNGYGWYVSSTATLLYSSYFLHNVVAWIKVAPFFTGQQPFFDYRIGKNIRRVYIGTLALSAPVLIFEAVNNFLFNNNINDLFERTRPYEFLMRDPWWLFTNVMLLHIIGKTYGIGILQLLRTSPRLAILLSAIFLAIVFTFVDLAATVTKDKLGTVDGIDPYWKLSLVCKCLTDAIMLDDFRTELRRLGASKHVRDGFGTNINEINVNVNKPPSPQPAFQIQPPARAKSRDVDIGMSLEIEHSV